MKEHLVQLCPEASEGALAIRFVEELGVCQAGPHHAIVAASDIVRHLRGAHDSQVVGEQPSVGVTNAEIALMPAGYGQNHRLGKLEKCGIELSRNDMGFLHQRTVFLQQRRVSDQYATHRPRRTGQAFEQELSAFVDIYDDVVVAQRRSIFARMLDWHLPACQEAVPMGRGPRD